MVLEYYLLIKQEVKRGSSLGVGKPADTKKEKGALKHLGEQTHAERRRVRESTEVKGGSQFIQKDEGKWLMRR